MVIAESTGETMKTPVNFATLRPSDTKQIEFKAEIPGTVDITRRFIWMCKLKMIWAIIRAKVGND